MNRNLLLFRKLTPTDFNGMTGTAQQAGTGGGAMHIPLGVNTREFPIREFLGISRGSTITLQTEPHAGKYLRSQLIFDGNPNRRNGEWRITDQFSHRHPAWEANQGFPAVYDHSNRPIIIVVRLRNKYHVRLLQERMLNRAPESFRAALSGARNKGILRLESDWVSYLHVIDSDSTLAGAAIEVARLETIDEEGYVPTSQDDARMRVIAEVVRRQGQPRFRRELMKAYRSKCAITGCQVAEVLEAAHISPYLGPQTNDVRNGLILRSDVHVLFDLALLSIDPESRRIHVSSLICDADYEAYDGRRLREPEQVGSRPSAHALRAHFRKFQR